MSEDYKLSISWLSNLLSIPVNSFLKATLRSLLRFKTPCKLSCLKLTDLFTYLHTHIHTYLHTQWSRVLLEKLTGFQLVKKFPAVYGNRRFITAFTSARHLSLSWASSIQFMPPHHTSVGLKGYKNAYPGNLVTRVVCWSWDVDTCFFTAAGALHIYQNWTFWNSDCYILSSDDEPHSSQFIVHLTDHTKQESVIRLSGCVVVSKI